ncbi:hypothetical protein KQI74_11470 [Paenibacillus barcinonensis]|uniref:hypothetical protein n=1 Tax=Paenibacillus barcinonensis TaxID=198119 RepID=UPI001C10582E|nr:hypothetical protein [Paenibacillus barcinonensis]MBU5352907.1 hypothetical protein [Paenibacillus barcinonensis]
MAESSDFRTLKILDRFRPIVARTGADYDVLRLILRVKFQMDQRRVPTIMSARAKSKDNADSNHYIRSLWLYALMGIIMVPFVIWNTGHFMLQMGLVYGILMFMIMSSMISDFSSVLLDIRDRNIVMTKPVNARTVGMARAIHTGVYLLLLSGSLTAAPLVAGLVKHGIGFFLIFLIELILINMLILFSTSLIYLLMMKFMDGEKLKDAINMIQILLSVSIAIGYQFVIRSFEIIDFKTVFTPEWWQLFLPPIWYAAAYEWLFAGGGSGWIYTFTALAVVVPVICLIIYVKLMPSFELYLEKMAHVSQTSSRRRGRWDRIIAKLVSRSREEQACFRLAASLMRNEREFKLQVYPVLALAFVLPYLFWLTALQTSTWAEFRQSEFAYTLYIMLFMVVTAVNVLRYSGQYKAAWVFRAVPIASENVLYQGTLKAFLYNLFLPLFLLNAVVFTWVFGVRILPDLVIILLASSALVPLSGKLLLRTPPFSESFSMAQKSGGWYALIVIPVLIMLWGIHVWFKSLPGGIWIYSVILIVANVLLWRLLYQVKKPGNV